MWFSVGLGWEVEGEGDACGEKGGIDQRGLAGENSLGKPTEPKQSPPHVEAASPMGSPNGAPKKSTWKHISTQKGLGAGGGVQCRQGRAGRV
jgi:hypothetical protein